MADSCRLPFGRRCSPRAPVSARVRATRVEVNRENARHDTPSGYVISSCRRRRSTWHRVIESRRSAAERAPRRAACGGDVANTDDGTKVLRQGSPHHLRCSHEIARECAGRRAARDGCTSVPRGRLPTERDGYRPGDLPHQPAGGIRLATIAVFMNGGARCISWQHVDLPRGTSVISCRDDRANPACRRAGRPAGPHIQQHPTAAPRGPRPGEHRSCPAQQRRSRRVCPGATGGEPSLRCPWTHPGSADGPAHQASYPAAAVKADLMNRPGGGDPVGVCEGYSPASRPLRSWVALREWWMRPPRLIRVP